MTDWIRGWVALGIRVLGWAGARRMRRRVRHFHRGQRALRRRYDVRADSPVEGFEAQHARLVAAAGPGTESAATSGSTGRPKEVPYPPRRVRAAVRTYVDAYCRMVHGLGIRRPSLYVFRALGDDDETSLTARMMRERRAAPPRLAVLQAPYRLHAHPDVAGLVPRHGAAAVRATVLALSNPGVLYATNPSTLMAFFDSLAEDWPRVRALAAATLAQDGPACLAWVRSAGASARLSALANASEPPRTERWLPGLEAWCTWDGGYVDPYLKRLRGGPLPPDRFRHVPTYSMSTEVVETLPLYRAGTLRGFFPLGEGVLYELRRMTDEALLSPAEAAPGEEYALVVSDRWGLRRYDTGDVFRCRALVDGLPDLRFARRAGLAWSFTGEKLTGQQVQEALDRLPSDQPITLVPSAPPEGGLPHYRAVAGSSPDDALCRRLDDLLGELNLEYAGKRRSGRLGPIRPEGMGVAALAKAASGAAWETQSKVLPLLPRTWEELLP